MTIWIPILFVCLVNGDCDFTQGNPGYTERGCQDQLQDVFVRLNQNPVVATFAGACFSFTGA